MNNKNQNKPGYKHTPFGWIPEEWEVKEFGKVVNLSKGKYVPELNEHKNCIELEHIEQGTGSINGFVDSSLQKSTKNVFKKGQVLFGKLRPYLQKYWLADFDGVCSSEVWVLQSNQKECFNEYLFRLIQQHRFIQVANVSSGSKMPRADWDFVSGYPFPLPPLPEQHKIATILSTWDEAITKTQQLITQLQQRNKGLMQQLLKSKEDWVEYRIGDLIKEVKRPVKWDDEELYHLISVRRRSGGAFYRESLYGSQILTKNLFTAATDDFLISKMQIVHGATAIVPKALTGMKISGSYIAVHAKDEKKIDIHFFNWLSKAPWFYRLAYISSYGVHIEKMTFNYDDFKRHKIMLPPTVKVQQEIVRILQTAVDEVKLHEQLLATLQQLKKVLMQKLLTGEVRVKI